MSRKKIIDFNLRSAHPEGMQDPPDDKLELVPVPQEGFRGRPHHGYWRAVLQKAVDNPGFAVRARATVNAGSVVSRFVTCRNQLLKPGQSIRTRWFPTHTLVWVEPAEKPTPPEL